MREESGRDNRKNGIGDPLMRSQTGDMDIRNLAKDNRRGSARIIAGDIDIRQGLMSIMEKENTMGERTVLIRHER